MGGFDGVHQTPPLRSLTCVSLPETLRKTLPRFTLLRAGDRPSMQRPRTCAHLALKTTRLLSYLSMMSSSICTTTDWVFSARYLPPRIVVHPVPHLVSSHCASASPSSIAFGELNPRASLRTLPLSPGTVTTSLHPPWSSRLRSISPSWASSSPSRRP